MQEMKGWLEGKVAELSEVPSSEHQFLAALSIACCVVECKISQNLKIKFVVSLLKMLNIQPDIKGRVAFLNDVTSHSFK